MKTDRARDELGWRPEHDAYATFEALWEGFRTAEGGANPPIDPSTSGRFHSHEFRTGIGARP